MVYRFGEFKPLCMCCVRVLRGAVVEYLALKPCCECEERGITGVLSVRISLTRILRGLQSRDDSVSDLVGLRTGTNLPNSICWIWCCVDGVIEDVCQSPDG